MRKLVFCGLTALLLSSAALVPQAEARCWWSGHGWHCWYPHAYRWHPPIIILTPIGIIPTITTLGTIKLPPPPKSGISKPFSAMQCDVPYPGLVEPLIARIAR